eukprot:6980104-Prymnesium_polylepis.1
MPRNRVSHRAFLAVERRALVVPYTADATCGRRQQHSIAPCRSAHRDDGAERIEGGEPPWATTVPSPTSPPGRVIIIGAIAIL